MGNVIPLRQSHAQFLAHEPVVPHSTILTEVAHDIKSPLLVLKDIIENSGLAYSEKQIATSALSRSFHILNKLNKPSVSPKSLSLKQLTNELLDEKSREYTEAEINFTDNSHVEKIISNSQDFKTALSNLINNSIEAGATLISIELIDSTNGLTLQISDNGMGVSSNKLTEIFQKGFSTKNGTGIGLSNAKETFKKEGADIQMISSENIGATLLITFKEHK
jgi:signal transduction histidine kinase